MFFGLISIVVSANHLRVHTFVSHNSAIYKACRSTLGLQQLAPRYAMDTASPDDRTLILTGPSILAFNGQINENGSQF